MLSDATALPLIAAATLPLRLALTLVLLWCAALVALTVAQRADPSDRRLQRSWMVAGAIIVGACICAAELCGVAALAGTTPPLAAALAAWMLTLAAAAGGLWAAVHAHASRRWIAVVASAAALLGSMLCWPLVLDWKTPPLAIAAAGLAAVASQAAAVWLMARWHRGERTAAWAYSARVALLPALAQALALTALALMMPMPMPSASAPGIELLFAALSVIMAALALQAGRMERHLVGKHQVLGVQLQQANAHLQRTPLSDPLTGLLSRLGLEAALRKAAAEAERQGQRVALFAIGLDGFKSVNDTFGHALGDSVLREVARRLVEHGADLVTPPKVVGHSLARLGGDEFVLMVQGHVDRQAMGRAASRLLEALDGPLMCDDQELRLSASIGIASFPEDGGASKLIARVNAAMQAAKAAGGSTFMSFEPRMQDEARDRHELLRDLRHAIEKKQLELFYQPKIDARSGQVTAAEALLRWHHPTRGTVAPGVFIPLAERHGLIGDLGNWVIEDACRQAKVWRERGLKMRVAINLSVFQMRQNDLVDRIQAALKRHGVNPSRLTCEITESVAMEDTQVTQRTFERLGQAGIHLSIDDFGTGYSSLAYLRRLPATELKIDRSFVMDLDTNADARAIVDAVLKLAHAIGLKVVAEGVENIRQRDILLQLGCDEFQGYLFARPMSARALLLWAVDDKPAKNAFRPSLFAETDIPSADGARSSMQAGVHTLRPPRARPPQGA